MATYDIFFHDAEDSNNLGFRLSLKEAHDYIEMWNGTDHSYFPDYKGGVVQIVCNETEETVATYDVK